jgi:pyrimidine operon attenuation protein/uracil phosphoribosyltransferase
VKSKKIIEAEKAVQKLNRIAYQILEENHDAEDLIVLGIANRGYKLSRLIVKKLKRISKIPIEHSWIKLDKSNPLNSEIEIGNPKLAFKGKTIIIIDDVCNTGRTLYYAMLPLAKDLPGKIQAAVLVDRMHKSFPIQVNFVGLSLATTLNAEVIVEFDEKNDVEGAYLY